MYSLYGIVKRSHIGKVRCVRKTDGTHIRWTVDIHGEQTRCSFVKLTTNCIGGMCSSRILKQIIYHLLLYNVYELSRQGSGNISHVGDIVVMLIFGIFL